MIRLLDRDVTELNRPHCDLFGCEMENEYTPACHRCGAYYYEGFVFREESIWWPIWDAVVTFVWRVKRLVWKYRDCDHCGKRFWAEKEHDACCSDACWSEWVPF